MYNLAKFIPLVYLVPLFARAQDFSNLTDFFLEVLDLINTILIPLVFALAILGFIWGLFKAFILGGTDEEKRAEGKKLMLWSIIAFVVMVALWGIVFLIIVIFGLNPTQELILPDVPGPGTPG